MCSYIHEHIQCESVLRRCQGMHLLYCESSAAPRLGSSLCAEAGLSTADGGIRLQDPCLDRD